MLYNTNFNQIVKDAANFVYCYQNHKEINDAEKETCKQFLDYLNISFDESKAAEALKSVIYDRLKTENEVLNVIGILRDLSVSEKQQEYMNHTSLRESQLFLNK